MMKYKKYIILVSVIFISLNIYSQETVFTFKYLESYKFVNDTINPQYKYLNKYQGLSLDLYKPRKDKVDKNFFFDRTLAFDILRHQDISNKYDAIGVGYYFKGQYINSKGKEKKVSLISNTGIRHNTDFFITPKFSIGVYYGYNLFLFRSELLPIYGFSTTFNL